MSLSSLTFCFLGWGKCLGETPIVVDIAIQQFFQVKSGDSGVGAAGASAEGWEALPGSGKSSTSASPAFGFQSAGVKACLPTILERGWSAGSEKVTPFWKTFVACLATAEVTAVDSSGWSGRSGSSRSSSPVAWSMMSRYSSWGRTSAKDFHLVASCLSQTSKLTRSVSVTGLTEWALQRNSCEPINTYRMCLLSSPSSWWSRTSWKTTRHVQVQSNEDGYFSEIRLVGQEQQGEQAIACAKPWLSPLAQRCAEAASHWSFWVGTSHVDSGATCNFFSLLASSNKGLILKMYQNAWWCQASLQRFWPIHRLWCSPCMSLPYSTIEKRNSPWCIPYCWELHKLVEEKHQVVELVVQAEWQRLSSLHPCLLIQQVPEPMIPSQLASWVLLPTLVRNSFT